jgi:cardiolipin synthase
VRDRRRAPDLRAWPALAALALSACSSLPVLSPDGAVAQRTVQIETAAGPVSAERSRAILRRLEAGGPETGYRLGPELQA